MSLSDIAVEERSKEAKTLRSFLAYSLISSLGIHIALLSISTNSFFAGVPNLEQEPIDVVIVDPPTPKTEKPIQNKPPIEKKQETKKEPQLGSVVDRNLLADSIGGSGRVKKSDGGNRVNKVAPRSQPPTTAKPQVPSISRGIAQKQPQLATGTVQKFSDNFKSLPERPTRTTETTEKPQPTRQIKPVVTEPKKQISEFSKPVVEKPPKEVAAKPEQTPAQPVLTSKPKPILSTNVDSTNFSLPQQGETIKQSPEKLTMPHRELRSSKASQGSAGNSEDSDKISSIGSGSKVAVGSGSNFGSGSGIGNGRGNSSGDGDGRAACRKCDQKYPESARRRGIEGRVDVAVDTDEKGNVINVSLAHSSGSRELDEATLKQAREWKLKPATGGRRGVLIVTEYAIEGSRRHRELQEHRGQTQAEQRNQKTTADSTSNLPDPTRRRRSFAGSVGDITPERTTRNQ